MPLERRYGFFRCEDCGQTWESSHTYVHRGTDKVAYKQECKQCRTSHFPYRTERIKCAVCGLEDCECTWEDKKERHVDPNKPHRSDLCGKCKAGRPCQKSGVY